MPQVHLYNESDDHSLFPELTKEHLNKSIAMAKGKRIKKVDKLVKKYGGDEDCWKKLTTVAVFKDKEYPNECFQIHWYECKKYKTGAVGLKRKTATCPPIEGNL